ncbi:AI-2E family transporter YdiK [Paraburkholderia oxyphila]|uniref:AI-2E family transporter YdiK n=1 Tax=Paraburkholderia oxyphila TaxID=614212 RepID=UPI001FDEF54B|nr:AI-2E family transporter YdiK [Paraburkholderia oxyphila]
MNAPSSGTPSHPPEPMHQRAVFDLPRIVLATISLLLLIGGSLYVLRPFVPALIWGSMIVVATWPPFVALQRRLGGRRAPAVMIMLLVQIAVIVVPFYAAVATLTSHATDITAFVKNLPDYALPAPPHWVANIPLGGRRLAQEWQTLSDAGPGGVLAKVQPYASVAARWLLARASQLGMFAVYLMLMVIVCGMLYARGEIAAQLVIRVAERVAPRNGEQIVHLAAQSVRAIALGVVVTAIIQASLGALGVWVAGVPFAGIIAALLLMFCLIQAGPLLPLLGCVAWTFANGSRVVAIVLLVWSIGVTMIDNFLRPILIRRAVELPLVLILFGVLGGLISIGVVGLFVGPVVLAVTYHLLLAWVGQPGSPGPKNGRPG